MSFVELIGFVISLIALIFLFFKNKPASDRNQIHPGGIEEENEENDPLREFLKSLEEEMGNEDQHRQPPPAPPKIKQVQIQNMPKPKPTNYKREDPSRKKPMDVRRKEKDLILFNEKMNDIDHLQPKAKQPSRLNQLVHHLPNKRQMIIYQQLLNKPKGLSSGEDLFK